MRKVLFLAFMFLVFETNAQNLNDQLASKRIMLPNGWSLSPAGRSIELGDLPLNIAVSKSEKLMAVTNNGQGIQTLQLINPKTEVVLDQVEIPKSFYGLKFSSNDRFLYASGGNDNWILKYELLEGKLKIRDTLVLGNAWPEKISPVGIEIDDERNLLYAVTKENNSLYVIDLLSKKIVHSQSIGYEGYTCVLSPDRKTLYISLWGGKKVAFFDTELKKIAATVDVSYNPNELILNRSGNTLYVANSQDNSVSVIDVKEKKVIEVLDAALFPDSPTGSTTNGLALSKDEKSLYIANADNNCLAVFNLSQKGKSVSKGFIPVGWFPTSVRVVGNKLFVSNGKGFSSFANPLGPQPVRKDVKSESHKGELPQANNRLQYIGNLMKGTMSVIDEPGAPELGIYSKNVFINTPYTKDKELVADGEAGNPVPKKVGEPSPIKYVFYVIKENRTYDQVFGDIREGNGDSTLTLFGEKYTPNQHKLAREYVLLDNFYVDAEVSADGHNWSLGAYATDYLEKTWPTGYGRRGGVTEGMGRRTVANNKDGFIWDVCKRNGVSFRTYGVFADKDKGNIPVLDRDHVCSTFTGYYDQTVKDVERFEQWKTDFDVLLSKNAIPQLSTIRLGADHTQGLAVGKPSPYACVADNDLAVGKLVEYISNSSIWSQSAIFILEDDAQNGPDHVDAHRSIAMVVSPYTKRNYKDHTMYSTSGMLRTMELILGLPPMSQYDAAAMPMFRSFTYKPDFTKFKAVSNQVDLNETNKIVSKWSKISEGFDFAEVDKNDDKLFNEVLWKGLKGDNFEMPAPRRSAFLKLEQKVKED
ncbi:MAG: alkaline phosphatase family protein [Pedobacter sp.]|jgi:YVTN family beta-propeller protein